MIFTFCVASPRPMLMTIFSIFGIAMTLVMFSSFASDLVISDSYFSRKRAAIIALFHFSTVAGVAGWLYTVYVG